MPSTQYWNSWYLSPQRMSSIGWQYTLCLESDAVHFLEIGAGSGLLTWMLRQTGKQVVTTDLVFTLNPNVISKLPALAFGNRTFDAALCFQVLEHLPFDQLALALAELRRVSRRWVIISLPDKSHPLPLKVKVARRIYQTFHFPPRWKPEPMPVSIDPQHRWEIGYNDITADTILDMAGMQNLQVVKHFRNELNPYHTFYMFKRTDR